jgi:uncharacterized membrane protein YecN with MAPEG domain
MSPFAITSVYAALCGLLILLLAWRVVEVRGSAKIGLGDGGHEGLQRRIRVHANAIETIPITLILLALAEAGGTPAWGLHLAGAALVVSRVLHAQGLSATAGRSFGRFWGTLVGWLVILGLSVWLLVRGVLG